MLEKKINYFFLLELTWPESSLSDGLHEEQLQVELDELDDDELLELSLMIPMGELVSILCVNSTRSGRWIFNSASHFFDNFGRLLTVLCHTIGKFDVLTKFWVTAMVSVTLSTTCHQPEGTNMISPGRCKTSIGLNCSGQLACCVLG